MRNSLCHNISPQSSAHILYCKLLRIMNSDFLLAYTCIQLLDRGIPLSLYKTSVVGDLWRSYDDDDLNSKNKNADFTIQAGDTGGKP